LEDRPLVVHINVVRHFEEEHIASISGGTSLEKGQSGELFFGLNEL